MIGAASSDEKLGLCRAHDADALINDTTQDLREAIKAATNGKGADVFTIQSEEFMRNRHSAQSHGAAATS